MLIKLFFLVKGVSLSRTSNTASVGCNVNPSGPTKLFTVANLQFQLS